MLRFAAFMFLIVIGQRTDAKRIFPISGSQPYAWTYEEAYQECSKLGAALASPAEMEEIQRNGTSYCKCGWLSDKSARYPMAEVNSACGGAAAVHTCHWRDNWDAFCYMGPIKNCSKPLGMESGNISDYQLSASSVYRSFTSKRWESRLARLNKKGLVNAWMPNHDDRKQYIEVDLSEAKAVTAVMTQGVSRYLRNQYLTQFIVKYSKDGDLWINYRNSRSIQVFDANNDNDGHVRNEFNPPILAQHIRIYPHSWHRHVSLRFELFGCSMDQYTLSRNIRLENHLPYSNDL